MRLSSLGSTSCPLGTALRHCLHLWFICQFLKTRRKETLYSVRAISIDLEVTQFCVQAPSLFIRSFDSEYVADFVCVLLDPKNNHPLRQSPTALIGNNENLS